MCIFLYILYLQQQLLLLLLLKETKRDRKGDKKHTWLQVAIHRSDGAVGKGLGIADLMMRV